MTAFQLKTFWSTGTRLPFLGSAVPGVLCSSRILYLYSLYYCSSSQETIFSIIISRVHRRLPRPNDSAAANRHRAQRRTTGRLTPSARYVRRPAAELSN